MRISMLIVICLCASVFLFSQQSFAALQPLADLSSFEQTGTWSIYPARYSQSTSWPSSSTPNSWSYTPTSAVPEVTVVTGTLPNFTYTDTWTGAASTISFYYNGTEYTASSGGSDGITTLILNVSNIDGPWVFNSGSLDIKPQSGPMKIYTMDNKFTGFYLNDAEITGTVNYLNFICFVPQTMYGNYTSLTGNITGSPVPIPAAVWLLGSGFLGLVGIRRRFKQ